MLKGKDTPEKYKLINFVNIILRKVYILGVGTKELSYYHKL